MRGGPGGAEGFDRGAAVTRSLLGYGVLAGAFYLTAGLVLAVTREGFELSRHPLSLLMLGEGGWLQRSNLGLSGAMVVAASVGFARALRGSKAAGRVGALLGTYGGMLMLSGIFAPDPMAGFPAGTEVGDPSLSGLLHLALGAVGFLCLAGAAAVAGGWFADRGQGRWAVASRAAATLVVTGFVGGAALSTQTVGIALLWGAVVVGWAWLAAASVVTYRSVPHPDAGRRAATAP